MKIIACFLLVKNRAKYLIAWILLNAENQMPFEPYNTGWIKSIYGGICLAWFLYTRGCLPHVISVMCYNNIIFIQMVELVNKLFQMIGSTIIAVGTVIVKAESLVFTHFNYIEPIYNGFQQIEWLISLVLIWTPAHQTRCTLQPSAINITPETTRVPPKDT